MRTKHGRITVAVAATVTAAVGSAQATSEEELEARWALADFQGVEKPGWDPARFGELAAEFGYGTTTVTAQGFAPRVVDEYPDDGLTPEERERRLALGSFVQVDKPDWDPVLLAELAARFAP